MAVTQAHVDALNEAIASGVRSATIGGDTTTYNTTASLIAARDDMVRQLAVQDATPRTGRMYVHYAGRAY